MKRAADYTFEENREDAMAMGNMLRRLNDLHHPTIALVQGPAYGGGVGLVSACDMAFAVHSARFTLSEVKLGLIPATIGPYVLAAIGERQARRYFLTAELFDAEEACRIGLVHQVVEDAAALAKIRERIASSLKKCAPGAVSDAKDLIANVAGRFIDEDLVADTARRIAERRASLEGQEGITAFLEKRKADWVES
jgi:methylglutaconyl-CoA hydratase